MDTFKYNFSIAKMYRDMVPSYRDSTGEKFYAT